MRKKILLWIFLGVLAALILWIVISILTSSGVWNVIFRNATAFDRNIPAPEFQGKSYERVAYSEVSPSDYLDLYVPDCEQPMPLLICVHGGGFVANDSQSRQATLMYQYFRANGYAVATINYRLAQEAQFPLPLSDVKAAVRFLRANAGQYGYDPERFAIWGESAGGYLAVMAAITDDGEYDMVPFIGEDPANPVSGKVDALIDFYGFLDFPYAGSDFAESGIPLWLNRITGGGDDTENSVVTMFLGKRLSELTAQELNEISSSYRAERLSKDRLKTYIAHGTVDITVAWKQSERFYDAMVKSQGVDAVEYHSMQNLKHADDRFYTPENLAPVKAFLEQVW